MQDRDEAQLGQLRLRVEEELSLARADFERDRARSKADTDRRQRLEEIEGELGRLRRSRWLPFRGRRRRAELSLLLSQRLLLDDLGVGSYAEYVRLTTEVPALGTGEDAAHAELDRRELASDQARLTDIEHGVLDLDWLANGARELGVVAPTETSAGPTDGTAEVRGETAPPLDAWRNPYVDATAPPPPRRTEPRLRSVPDPSPPSHWTESA